jgi:hypothetical protein
VRLAAILMILAGASALAPAAEARKHDHVPGLHLPHVRTPRAHKPRPPRKTYRSVRIRRADGSVWTGYRDDLGTHLTGPDGQTVHCRRGVGAADIEVACR